MSGCVSPVRKSWIVRAKNPLADGWRCTAKPEDGEGTKQTQADNKPDKTSQPALPVGFLLFGQCHSTVCAVLQSGWILLLAEQAGGHGVNPQ